MPGSNAVTRNCWPDEFVDRGQLKVSQLMAPGDRPLLIYGLPGMGKTTLLKRLQKRPGELEAAPEESRTVWVTVYRDIEANASDPLTWPQLLMAITAGVPADNSARPPVMALETLYRAAGWHDGQTYTLLPQPPVAAAGPETPQPPQAAPATVPPGGSWQGYFDDLQRVAPDVVVLFLLDNLDHAAEKERIATSQAVETVTAEHVLKLSRGRPNLRLIATRSKLGRDELPPLLSDLSPFEKKDLPPFTRDDMRSLLDARGQPQALDAVAEWSGGIPELVCSYLSYFDEASGKAELPRPQRKEWLQTCLAPWYERVSALLPNQQKYPLERVAAAPRGYVVNETDSPHEIAALNPLVQSGLVERISMPRPAGAPTTAWSYKTRARGLQEHLRGPVAERSRWARFNPLPFTSDKFLNLVFATFVPTVLTILFLSLQFDGAEPLWGLLWMALPAVYGVIGLLRPES